jgi:hypothetical protein
MKRNNLQLPLELINILSNSSISVEKTVEDTPYTIRDNDVDAHQNPTAEETIKKLVEDFNSTLDDFIQNDDEFNSNELHDQNDIEDLFSLDDIESTQDMESDLYDPNVERVLAWLSTILYSNVNDIQVSVDGDKTLIFIVSTKTPPNSDGKKSP